MMRIILVVIAVGALIGGVIWWGQRSVEPTNNSVQEEPDTPPNTDALITIEEFAYAPAKLTIKKGTTVKWLNRDSVKHTVTKADEFGPESPLLGRDETYSFRFDRVGTFTYYCQPHPYMKAVIEVVQ